MAPACARILPSIGLTGPRTRIQRRSVSWQSDHRNFAVQAGSIETPPSVTHGIRQRHGAALLIAASPSHESDRTQKPTPLLSVGGVAMVNHALWQLNNANFAKVIVVIGYQGDQVRSEVNSFQLATSSLDVRDPDAIDTAAAFDGLHVEFVDLGKGWRGGRTASIIKSRPAIQKMLPHDSDLVIVGADHMFDDALLKEAATVDLQKHDDLACVLVETDLAGMVGLARQTVYCAMRPLHGADRVYSIGTDLQTYSGIEAGLIIVTRAALDHLENEVGRSTQPLNSMLDHFAKQGSLRMMMTEGRTWFQVETDESTELASQGLQQGGYERTLSDGQKVHLIGLPKKIDTSVPGKAGGGEWAEFNVGKWRDAMFTASSFFQDLFIDTTHFIAELAKQKGGCDEVMLVEVGCGTGEAMTPLYEHFKYSVGVEYNPHFVDFCKENVPPERRGNVTHLLGDAQELIPLLNRELPEWMADTKSKIVICVGNTAGIMPPEVRQNVYQQMKLLAGKDGYIVQVYWNGNRFGHAVQHFYHKNPQLCGPFTGECIDLDTCTLTTPSGYCTHWTKPEEARAIFESEIGVEVVALEEKGNGVLIAGRMRSD